MLHFLALETPDGTLLSFSSPMPWAAGTMVPTINGRSQTEGFVTLNNRTVRFTEAPCIEDTVGFFLVPVTV